MLRVRNAPLGLTLTVICWTLVFGVHCGSGASGFRESALYCQTAAAQLGECCPGYDPGLLSCDQAETSSNDEGSCYADSTTTKTTYPTLSEAEAMCILGQSCASLQATNVCARAIKALGNGPVTTTTVDQGCATETYYEDAEVDAAPSPPPPAGPVCP